MDPGELNEASQQKQGQNFIIKNINDLNEDCLIHIFEFLPIGDKLKAEMVCTRWKNVGKLSWSKVNNLEIGNYLCVKNSDNGIKLINFLKNVLIRCGSYVINLIITKSIFGLKKLTLEIVKYCTKMQKVYIIHKYEHGFYDDNDLKLLFNHTRIMYMYNVTVNGDCLEHLPVELLEELIISKCNIINKEYLYELLSKAKNLTRLRIYCNVDSGRVFNALNDSGCTSISDFLLWHAHGTKINYNLEFIKRQKILLTISLKKVLNAKDVLTCLQKDKLEEILFVTCDQELINFVSKCLKLHIICFFYENNDYKTFHAKYVKIVSDIIDVKFIKFSKSFCVLSSNYASFLKYLIFLNRNHVLNKFSAGIEFNMDKLLNIIKPCKNLETLNIGGCNFTGLGVTYINKFSNLKNLYISLNDKVADEWVISIVKKLQKLEKLSVFHCPLITNKSIKQANEIKKKRNDAKKLEVFCYGTKITKNDFQNDDLMIILNDVSINLKI